MGKYKKGEISIRNKRGVAYSFGIIVLFLVALIIKCACIQLINDDFYREEAKNQQTNDVSVTAKRGDITDRNGTILATSVTSYTLSCNPTEITKKYAESEVRKMAQDIADILYLDEQDVNDILASKEEAKEIADYLSRTQVNSLKALNYDGLKYSSRYTRYYPFNDFASQLIGSMTVDNTGRTGLELEYESYLAGINGRMVKTADVDGNELEGSKSTYYAQQDGLNVVTTIDSTVQFYAEEAIKNAVAVCNPKRLMCLVMDPNTGEILASAATDGFDCNNPYVPTNEEQQKEMEKLNDSEFVDYVSSLWRNPLVSDLYEFGSVIKLFTAAAALEEGVIDLEDLFYCDGHLEIDEDTIYCAHGEAHYTQNIYDIMANSCNVAISKVAFLLGRETMYKYLNALGLNSCTGIDYPGEADSLVKDKNYLANIDLANMSFGQGIAITPIQYLTAANALINGGYLITPRYVSKLTDNDGNAVVEYKKNIVRRVFSEETSNEMRSILEYTVNEGTAYNGYIKGYQVGGKTGTAEKAVNGVYSKQVLSYIGFAPMDDPKVSVFIIMDEPEIEEFAATVVAPIVREVFENILPYLGVDPNYSGYEDDEYNEDTVEVPYLIGYSYSDAVDVLDSLGLEVQIADNNANNNDFEIIAQYPLEGSNVNVGSTVYIYRG